MNNVGQTVLYLMGRPEAPEHVPAVIRGQGTRKRSGSTYYVIEPIVEGVARRRRVVAWYSVKFPSTVNGDA